MTTAQLDSLVTLLRSRPAPETPDVGEVRARFEKMASSWAAHRTPSARRSMPAACRRNG